MLQNAHHAQKRELEIIGICPICDRGMISGVSSDEHHWIPQSKGGKKGPKSLVHRVCHSKIHSIRTEKELAKKYDNAEIIKSSDEMKDFLKWIRRKEPGFHVSTKMHNRKR